MRTNLPVTNTEIDIDPSALIVSKTDLKGRITYVNADFLKVSGFSEQELIGEPHNIVRHPDMPPEAFEDLWRDLKAGRPWVGLVKNRCKNGDFYWVEAHAAPIWENGDVVGYMSVRRKPQSEQIRIADQAYRAFLEKRATGRNIRHGNVVVTGLASNMAGWLRNSPLTFRFLLPSIVALIVILSAAGLFIGKQISQTLRAEGEDGLTQQVKLTRAMMETTLDAVEREATRLLDIYAARYPGSFSLDSVGLEVPQLRHNKVIVNDHHDEEDQFARITKGPTATILVRRGDEFVRIATSQKNEKGERVVHTVLDKDGPATGKLLNGEIYIGRTSSQGKDRISALKPIKDETGKIIGAFGIGYFITSEMATLREKVKAVKLGETGYIYVIDTQPGKRQGDLFIHPAKEGSNVLGAKDASGREFIREMLERKSGIISYPWKNTELGETDEREKVVAFETMPRWNLLVGGGTYRDEFDHLSRTLYTSLIAAGVVAVFALILVMVFVSRTVLTRRLQSVLATLKSLSTGHYKNDIDVAVNDELGQVLQGLESMQTRLGFEVAETKRQSDEMTRIKIGLDNVATNVRIADNEGNILYINHALQKTFERDTEAFRKNDPSFDPKKIVGTNIGRLYDDPVAAINRLRNLDSTARTQMVLGGRHYDVTTTPVMNDSGERLGSVGEWLDVTDQLKAQNELTEIIRKAADGDFSVRLALHSSDPFYIQVETLINQLLSNGESALGELAEVLSDIANGNLTTTINSEYKGIFGALKDNTNTTVDQLKLVIGQIKEAAEAINIAAQEIASGNQDLSGRTEQQASSLEETSSSMEELNATVRQNSENAGQANQLATEANTAASESGEMVQRVVKTMSDIQVRSHKIADIIGVIDSIAFQTNILALNAAVEAARAGEQGRGFAVVASEVRNLAQRSASSAKEIRELISDSVGKVDSGVMQVRQAGDAMKGVVSTFERLARLVTDISNASREQSTGIEQVTHAVGQMDDITQQNAALVEEAAAAAESLEEQARALTVAVGRFNTGESSSSIQSSLVLSSAKPVRNGGQKRQLPPPRKSLPASNNLGDEWEEF